IDRGDEAVVFRLTRIIQPLRNEAGTLPNGTRIAYILVNLTRRDNYHARNLYPQDIPSSTRPWALAVARCQSPIQRARPARSGEGATACYGPWEGRRCRRGCARVGSHQNSPNLPVAFAQSAAYGDLTAAALALL